MKQILLIKKSKPVICRFCGKAFDSNQFTEILKKTKACRFCYEKRRSELNPSVWGQDEANKIRKE